jgi:hypothetical protein
LSDEEIDDTKKLVIDIDQIQEGWDDHSLSDLSDHSITKYSTNNTSDGLVAVFQSAAKSIQDTVHDLMSQKTDLLAEVVVFALSPEMIH